MDYPVYTNGTYYLLWFDFEMDMTWAVVADPSHNFDGIDPDSSIKIYYWKNDLNNGAMWVGGAGEGPPPYLTNNL